MPNVLEEAQTIIYGDREQTYGSPSKNLETIARMWRAYLSACTKGIDELNAKDVAAMMMLVKVARFANNPLHRDNLVDICGYAALVERCDETPKEWEACCTGKCNQNVNCILRNLEDKKHGEQF